MFKKITTNKDKVIKIFLVTGIIMCVFGIMDKLFENTVFNLFKHLTLPYLEKSYEESKKLFITLSLLKGTADIIEGSTVNVSMILGMEIQLGDIIKPVYDVINILWQISLASVVVLKLETLYYEIFRVKIASFLIFISLISYFPYTFIKNKITLGLKNVAKYSFITLLFIYTVLPGAILVSSGISGYFEKEYKEPAVTELLHSLDKLNEVKDGLFILEQSKGIFNIPGQMESAKSRFDGFGKEISNVSKKLADNTPIIIGITLLSYIILPLIIVIFFYKLVKTIVLDKISK